MLSVQVHPSDSKVNLIPEGGKSGKTEAWIVLEAASGSRVYAGLNPGATATDLRALSEQTVNTYLPSFAPIRGQGVLIKAGGVQALSAMESSSSRSSKTVTLPFDCMTGIISIRRQAIGALQVEEALACIDFRQGAIRAVVPIVEALKPAGRELLFDDPHFRLWRFKSAAPFAVGAADVLRVLVVSMASETSNTMGPNTRWTAVRSSSASGSRRLSLSAGKPCHVARNCRAG